MEAELPQIRLVLDWLRDQGDFERGLKLTYLLQELWFEEPHTAEGLKRMQEFLARVNVAESTAFHAMSTEVPQVTTLNRAVTAAADRDARSGEVTQIVN